MMYNKWLLFELDRNIWLIHLIDSATEVAQSNWCNLLSNICWDVFPLSSILNRNSLKRTTIERLWIGPLVTSTATRWNLLQITLFLFYLLLEWSFTPKKYATSVFVIWRWRSYNKQLYEITTKKLRVFVWDWYPQINPMR